MQALIFGQISVTFAGRRLRHIVRVFAIGIEWPQMRIFMRLRTTVICGKDAWITRSGGGAVVLIYVVFTNTAAGLLSAGIAGSHASEKTTWRLFRTQGVAVGARSIAVSL